MPRPHRIEFNGAWYLVKNYGADGENIFNDDEDRELFLELLGEVSQIFSIEVHAYALFDDHYSLLVYTPKAQLSRAMRHLNGIYTQRFNATWDYDGPVFSGRYKSLVVDPNKYLVDVACYLHALPAAMGLCRKAVDYKWSSHRGYMHDRDRPEWLKTDRVVKALGGFLKTFSLSKLNKLVNKGVSEDFEALINKESVILGDAKFKEKVKGNNKVKKSKESKKQKGHVSKEILDFISFHYKVPVADIKNSHSGVQNEARSMAVYQLRAVAGLPQKEIARVLNSTSGYTVAKTLQRFNDKLAEDKELHKATTKLTKNIQFRVKIN